MSKEPLISIRDLSKTFHIKDRDFVALKNINLDIYAGEIFGIIGMSGAGKSTLVRCMNLLERPTEGSILFQGEDLAALSNRQLRAMRQDMAMIFQQFNLLMQRTALENVIFPLEIGGMKKAEAKEKGLELLEVVGLANRADAYPAQLSGGQKQRVAIARALATNPKVLLCDEATSALDPETTASILELLRDLSARLNITIVIITHEMSVIEKVCDRVAIIAEHEIAEVGSVAEIFSSPKTEATKRLVYRDRVGQVEFAGDNTHQLRIVFDGESSFEPVIAQMILDLRMPVNIVYANTRNIEGRAFGEIVIQLPPGVETEKPITYVKARGLHVEEVLEHV